MLNQDDVNKEEERLRVEIASLPDESRKEFYLKVKSRIKDPDTYAALNWFFITGIHHFYLGKWFYGILDLSLFLVGVMLVIMDYHLLGFSVIVFISVVELWALFRSQIIIQDWNNKVYRDILDAIKV